MKQFARHIVLLLLLALTPTLKAQTPHLSDSAFAGLITCGPGDEFYSTFGHTAIRICDSAQGIDVVYNYGMFTFNIDHFYWNFAKGNLNYWVCRDSFSDFLVEYMFEQRSVVMQRLNLTNQELNNLFVFLEWNVQPENRHYQYDFFRDNCATRARDAVFNCLSHRTVIAEQRTKADPSYRNMVYQSTESTLLWWRFGIDLLLGARCDQHASNLEQMFSPINMMQQFDTLSFSNTHEPLVAETIQILPDTRQSLSKSISPTLVFWLLFVVVLALTLAAWWRQWRLLWLDGILFTLVGLISLVILFLWAFSTHYCTKLNLNLLWCSPIFLFIALRLRHTRPLVYYTQMALLFIFVIGFWWMPQQFNAACMPIALTLLIRIISKFKTVNNHKL